MNNSPYCRHCIEERLDELNHLAIDWENGIAYSTLGNVKVEERKTTLQHDSSLGTKLYKFGAGSDFNLGTEINEEVEIRSQKPMNTVTDDQGNKWQFIEIFNHDVQSYVYVLQPVPLKDGRTWVEVHEP